MQPNEIPIPKEPLKVALIGAGNRASVSYRPVFGLLKPWIELVAVCDPVEEHANAMAEALGIRAYYDIHKLVADKPMEAALIVIPVSLHHSVSVYLSDHGIHNMSETTWCSLVAQAREMIETARKNNLIVRVAENFVRFPIDCFSHLVRDSEYLGRIGRIFGYAGSVGYHHTSRWIGFAQSHPLWVQSIEHTMAVPPFYCQLGRYNASETFRARYFLFPNDLMVIDSAANIKGFLGRHPRPGYIEWQGERGTLVHRADVSTSGDSTIFEDSQAIDREPPPRVWAHYETELRYCSDRKLHQEGEPPGGGGGTADEISPVKIEYDEQDRWTRMYCDTSAGQLQYVNPYPHRDEGASAIMAHIVDFALAVRGLRESEFDEADAMMSLMMNIGAQESAISEGKRIRVPLEGELEAEGKIREAQKKQYGVDPMDVEGMLTIKHPRM